MWLVGVVSSDVYVLQEFYVRKMHWLVTSFIVNMHLRVCMDCVGGTDWSEVHLAVVCESKAGGLPRVLAKGSGRGERSPFGGEDSIF